MEEGETPEELLQLQDVILGGGIEAVMDQVEEEDVVKKKRKVAGQGCGEVMARPSGSNSLTFFMNDSMEEGEEQEEQEEQVPDREEEEEDEKEKVSGPGSQEEVPRERELTEKYLAGKLSFRDLMQEMNDEEEAGGEEEDEEEESEDEEWRPPAAGRRARAGRPSREEERGQGERRKSSMECFESELEDSQKSQLRRRRKGPGARRKRLDPALQGLMGEANLRAARGDTDTAERMCMEVIRQDPTAPEPFQALATLYEEQGELERSLQFGLLAAHLAPQDGEEWARLADMSLEQQGEAGRGQAADCYRKAIEADPSVARYHSARAHLLEQMGDKKGALRCYKRLLGELGPGQGEDFLLATKHLSSLLHEREALEEAARYFAEAFDRFEDSVTGEYINLYLELLISLGDNNTALQVICQWCGVQFSGSEDLESNVSELGPEEQLAAFTELLVPEDMAADLQAKLVVVLAHLKALHLGSGICEMFLEAEMEELGDLVLDMVEAMMAGGEWAAALPFLLRLSVSRRWGEAAVWLQLAECQAHTGGLEEAEQSYSRVVELAPHHYQARLQLSLIMQRLGRAEDALDTLQQDEQAELLNPHLMYSRCQLLLTEKRLEEFISKASLLFSRHFVTIRNKDELHAVSSAKKMSSKNKALHEVRNFRCEPLTEVEGPEFQSENQVTVEQEYSMYRQVCEVLFQQGRYVELQRLTFSALGSPVFARKAEVIKECEFLCLLSSFFNGDSYHAYNLVRELVVKNVGQAGVWNLFNLVIMRADDVRHNRFLMRLMSRNPDSLALGMLNGHNCLVAGTYKYSLGEYMSAFKADSSNPLTALMLGLTFTHMACQKFSAKKHSLVVQACSFLNTYRSLRGDCQEVLYNIGRAMHQLNLLPAALFYYKRGLEVGPALEGGEDKDQHNIFDLSREIAFNMSLIYKGSGNLQLARMYTEKYITV